MLPSGILTKFYGDDIAIIRTRTQWLLLIIGLVFLATVAAEPILADIVEQHKNNVGAPGMM